MNVAFSISSASPVCPHSAGLMSAWGQKRRDRPSALVDQLPLFGLRLEIAAVSGDAVVFDLLIAFVVEDRLDLALDLAIEIGYGRAFVAAMADE